VIALCRPALAGYDDSMKKIALFSTVAILALLVSTSTAHAWARHETLTRLALAAMAQADSPAARELAAGLRDLPVVVTAYGESDDSLNPEYRPDYVNPDPTQAEPDGRYVFYDLESPRLGYRGAAIGATAGAAEILAWYSDEPDWGMDRNLNGGIIARLMGGTQGMRHMFYPRGTWHAPKPFLDQGEAPTRFAHFIERSRRAFARGDAYWGWRHLARALHYLQDLAQPFHTTQAPWSYYDWGSPINGTTETTTNYHFAFESLAANLLAQWRRAEEPAARLLTADKLLPNEREAGAVVLDLRGVARETIRRQGDFFALTKPLLGPELQARETVIYREEQYRRTLAMMADTDEGREFLRLTTDALRRALALTWALLAQATR